MEVDLGEPLDDEVKQVAPLELLDVSLETEVLVDRARRIRERVEVVGQVRADLRRVIEESLEVELGRVVERLLGGALQRLMPELLGFPLQLGRALEHGLFGRLEHAVQS